MKTSHINKKRVVLVGLLMFLLAFGLMVKMFMFSSEAQYPYMYYSSFSDNNGNCNWYEGSHADLPSGYCGAAVWSGNGWISKWVYLDATPMPNDRVYVETSDSDDQSKWGFCFKMRKLDTPGQWEGCCMDRVTGKCSFPVTFNQYDAWGIWSTREPGGSAQASQYWLKVSFPATPTYTPRATVGQ